VADTPFGRIATIICFDADFPSLVRQAGKAGVDILLVPSSDFGTVGETHARASILRAVENGTALFRPTRIGVSVAVDHNGRQLGYQDDYASGAEQTMWALLPTEGETTLYSVLGDGAGWASVLGMIGMTGVAVFRKRNTRSS
jgi:apolipoprotein N-acyltransferase